MRSDPGCRLRRVAFTLVELLVVIAIIGILTSLGAWGMFAFIGGRYRSNTEATIRTVARTMLQSRWAAVIADAKKETPSDQVLALAGGDANRARVIWIKVRLSEAFPMAYKEMNPADTSTIVNTYIPASRQKPHFAKYRSTVTAYPPTPGPAESSACLLLALNTLQSDGVSVNDQLKHAISDTDNDGLAELIDSWGYPLAFYRFPWNNADLQAANPGASNARTAKFADPIDSGGTLINRAWMVSNNRPIYEAAFHSVTWPNYASAAAVPPQQQLVAAFVTPVIVSAGPDGKLDLGTDLSVTGAGANDNIYSFKLRGD